MKPLAFIGLDPGTTTAYAVLDLNGEVLKLFSAKELSLAETIAQVIEVCLPVLTATDKNKLPSFIEEFSRKLGTQVFVPEKDLLRQEKRLLVQENIVKLNYNKPILNSKLTYSKLTYNDHELDSLAAALFAYKKYLPRINKINNFLASNFFSAEQQQEFTRLALKEELNFTIIKEIITKNNEEENGDDDKKENKEKENEFNNETENKLNKNNFLKLYQQITRLKKEKFLLEKKIKELNQNLHQTQKTNLLLDRQKQKINYNVNGKIEQLFKFKEERLKLQSQELNKQEEVIASLQQKIRRIYSFVSFSRQEKYQLIKKLANFSQKEFLEKNKLLQIQENDFLLVQNPQILSAQVLEELKHKNITILSTEKINPQVRDNFAHLLIKETELIEQNEYFALLEKKVITAGINRKDLIEQIITDYQKR